MPFVPMLNTAQAELVFTKDGQKCQYVLHYSTDIAVTVGLMTELGEALVNWYDNSYAALQHVSVTLEEVTLTDMSDQFEAVLNYTTGLPLPGTRTGDALPNNVAAVTTKRTPFRGRSFRGRIYNFGMVFFDTNSANRSQWSPTFVGNVTSAWDAARTFDLTSAEWLMVVASTVSGGVQRENAVLSPVTNFTTDSNVDSQRRRLVGRGQ